MAEPVGMRQHVEPVQVGQQGNVARDVSVVGHEEDLVPALIRVPLRRKTVVCIAQQLQVKAGCVIERPFPVAAVPAGQADCPADQA